MGVYTPDSNRVVHYTYADMTARQIVRPVHLVQYDQGLPIIAVKLYNDGLEYTIPANATVNIRCGKVDGNFVYNPALGWDSAMHTVYFEVTKQMTALAGEINPIVEIELNNKIVSSGAIAVQIDFNPVQEQSIKSTTEYITGKQYAEQAVDAAARASNSANEAAGYANTASKKADESSSFAASSASSASSANSSMLDAKKYADKASLSAASASQSATAAADSADEAESYAASWKGSLLPQGVVAFSELPTSGLVTGHLYAVKDKFITDGRFEEGEKHQYPAGTCVYWTKENKWKVLSGVLSLELTKAEYDALTDAQKKNGTIYYVKDADNFIEADEINGLAVVAISGNYNDLKNKPSSLPASDVSDWAKAKTKPSYSANEVGLGNVGNFKAVSTVASQGLSDTEKSNARTNIGAQAAGTYLTEHQDISGKLDNTATGANSLLSNLTASWTAAPTDDTNFIRQDTGGKNEFGRVKFSTLLTYINSKLSKVAASGSYNDLSNKPTIPSVGNGIVTIKQAGTVKGTFTTNQSGNTTVELSDSNTNTWRGIQNNLTSDSTSDSLSAAQGKVLKELVDSKVTESQNVATDLNNIKSTGIHHISASTSNNPTGTHGTLFAEFNVGTPYQIWLPDNSNTAYKRNYTTSTSSWGKWTQLKFTDTVYSAATQSANGLMSPSDKKKLDGITSGANAVIKVMSATDYSKLTDAQKKNGTIYLVN